MGNRQSSTRINQSPPTTNAELSGSSAPRVHARASRAPTSLRSASGSSNDPFNVFISHAGEDKVTIAIPLRKELRKRGITAFVDMKDMRAGTESEPAMLHAMETASVGVVVLSPEFVARKWPMKELMCFLRRHKECKDAGIDGPTIIPFFYRLEISELYDEPRLDRNDKDGKKLYESSRFNERQRKGEPEANIAGIKAALRSLHGFMGLENFVKANNDTSYEMRFNRKTLLKELVKKICETVQGPTVKKSSVRVHGRELENDMFRAHFDEAYDVSELVFDFERRDSNDNICTQEGKMLEMLLDKSKDRNRAIAVQGISGVGKSSLLRKIRSLKKVHERFRDGLYYMELGKDATRESLKEKLVSLVLKSGGKQIASNMRAERDIRKVMEGFLSWFAEKQCLFVIDDVWDTKEVPQEVVRDLCTMHTSGRDSKTLLTTRSSVIAAEGNAYACLESLDPLETKSREILYRYAGLKPEEKRDENNKAVEEILVRCAGLPLFLGVAGKGVKTISFRPNRTEYSAYRLYANQLDRSMSEMMNTGVGLHIGLSAGLKISIELVEERKERFEFDVSCSVAEMYRRLSVMKKKMLVPMTMLKELWEVENESEAARIAKEFEQVGLANVEYEEPESGFVEIMRVHDSVYEYALYETKRLKEEKVGHKAVLDGYGKGLSRSSRFRVMQEWWNEELKDDGYIHRNVCRHLLGAGRDEELLGLLLTPKWLERQVELNGVVFAKEDFSVGIEAVQKRTDAEAVKVKEALELTFEAITLSSSFALKNGRELWFQVHGRLKRAGKYNQVVREYVERIETNAPKPGVLCMNGILMEAGGPNTGIIHVGSGVYCIVLLKDEERLACGCSSGDIAIVNIRRSEKEMQWRAHDGSVTAIDVGEDDKRIVSGSWDRTAKVWDVQSGLCVASFERHRSVTCVAMTQDGKRVVCDCSDGSIQVFDMERGLRVGGSMKLFTLRCLTVFKDGEHVLMKPGDFFTEGEDKPLEIWNATTNAKVGASFEGDTQLVQCATLSEDESRLVSGSSDGTVRLWDVERRQQVGNSFKGHTEVVTCVAVSCNGRRICGGSSDRTIRVWDVESGKHIGDPLIGHTMTITGVSLLKQGDTIVSSSKDGTVRVWDLKRERKTMAINKHEGCVRSISFSPDGKFVVSGSDDGTLRIWNTISVETVGEPIREEGFDYRISAVAITPSGRFVVSGSSDGRVRVWDLQTRKLVHTFEGHTGDVKCVAVTPDGERAVTGSDDKTVRVWDLKSMDGSHLVLKGHSADVEQAFVSDDGKRIISVQVDDEIFVWDIKSQKESKRTRKAGAWLMSRRDVLNAAGTSTAHDEAGLSIRRFDNRIVHGEGSEVVILGTLDDTIWTWNISPERNTICVGLRDGQVGFLKLELQT